MIIFFSFFWPIADPCWAIINRISALHAGVLWQVWLVVALIPWKIKCTHCSATFTFTTLPFHTHRHTRTLSCRGHLMGERLHLSTTKPRRQQNKPNTTKRKRDAPTSAHSSVQEISAGGRFNRLIISPTHTHTLSHYLPRTLTYSVYCMRDWVQRLGWCACIIDCSYGWLQPSESTETGFVPMVA